MPLALATQVESTFDEALDRTRAALSDQGFGVLTTIDMTATLREKIGVDMERYTILGACNPSLAHRAVDIDRQIGLLLPCNVVVRAETGNDRVVHVEAMDPQIMVQVTGQPGLAPVAEEAGRLLQAAIDAIGS
jgi:uncharacterized protein (DUF302 family)